MTFRDVILNEIKKRNGITYTQILKYIVEEIYKETYDHKKHRGMHSIILNGKNGDGILKTHCVKIGKKYYVGDNDESNDGIFGSRLESKCNE